MNTRRIDAISRAIALSTTRRAALGGAILAAFGSRVEIASAAAGCCKCSGTTDCQDTNSENACKQVCGTASYTFTKDATCTNKKCKKNSSSEPETPEERIDWLYVEAMVKQTAAGLGVQDLSGTLYIRQRNALRFGTIHPVDQVESLPDDWIGTLNQTFLAWNPDNPSGMSVDINMVVNIDVFGSSASAKKWLKFKNGVQTDAEASEISSDESGVNGLHLFNLEGPMVDKPDVSQETWFGSIILESTSVANVLVTSYDTPIDARFVTDIATTIKSAVKQTTTDPLSAFIVYPDSVPNLGISIERFGGVFFPLASTTDADNAPFMRLYGDSEFHYSCGVQTDAPSIHLQFGVKFSDGTGAQEFFFNLGDTVRDVESNYANPPIRQDVSSKFTSLLPEGFDQLSANAVIFPQASGPSYVGAEVTLLRGEWVLSHLMAYPANAGDVGTIENWAASEQVDRLVDIDLALFQADFTPDPILGRTYAEEIEGLLP